MEKLKLYSYYRSSCSYRVRIALYYKKIDFEYCPVSLIKAGGEQFNESYKKLNPFSQVPSLKQGEKVLTQSLPILLYLEEIQAEPALLPSEPFQKAEVLSFCEMINSGIQPLQNLAVLKRVGAVSNETTRWDWAKYWMEKGLVACETFLKNNSHKSSGLYCFYDELSLADLFLIPQIYNAHRFDLDMKKYPLLEKINKHCLSLESFQKASPQNQPDSPSL